MPSYLSKLHKDCLEKKCALTQIRYSILPYEYIFKGALLACLRAFLSSTSSTYLGTISFPLSKRIRSSRINIPNDTKKYALNKNSEAYYQHLKYLSANKSPSIRSSDISRWLAEGFELLNDSVSQKKTPIIKRSIPQLKTNSRQAWHARIELFRKRLACMLPDVHGIYAHGSYAIGDPIYGYSDIDTLMVIKKTSCISSKLLDSLRARYLRLSPFIYSFDMQQHHEIFILSEFDLLLRSSDDHEDILWSEARTLVGNENILMNNTIHDPCSAKISFVNLMISILKFISTPKLHNWYHTKNFLHHIALIPAIYYQSHGLFLTKKEAINKIIYEQPLAEVVKTTTIIRDLFKRNGLSPPPEKKQLMLLKINPQLTRIFNGMRTRTPVAVTKAMGENYLDRTARFITALYEETNFINP